MYSTFQKFPTYKRVSAHHCTSDKHVLLNRRGASTSQDNWDTSIATHMVSYCATETLVASMRNRCCPSTCIIHKTAWLMQQLRKASQSFCSSEYKSASDHKCWKLNHEYKNSMPALQLRCLGAVKKLTTLCMSITCRRCCQQFRKSRMTHT